MDLGILRTRVARRILLLFLLCALLPAGALTVISYVHVRDQLYAQSRERMAQVSKSTGMAVYERLLTLQDRLTAWRSAAVAAVTGTAWKPGAAEGLRAVALVVPGRAPLALLGPAFQAPPVTRRDDERLAGGNGVLRIETDGGAPRIFLGLRLDPGGPGAGMLWGELDQDYLWQTAEQYAGLPTTAGFCVLERGIVPLHCTYAHPEAFVRVLAQEQRIDQSSTDLEWRDASGRQFIANAWQLFLEAGFDTAPWAVVVAERRDAVLAPMASFRNAFLAVTLLALGTVALLSNVQIRRSMGPLVKLQEGTRRIAERDFASRVDVRSGDEFEELASSFNLMARRLGAQFNALTAIDEIDRAILSSLDRATIAATVASKVGAVLPADTVVVGLRDPTRDAGRFQVFLGTGDSSVLVLTAAQQAALSAEVDHLVLPAGPLDAGLLAVLPGTDPPESALLLPVLPGAVLEGFIALGHTTPVPYAEEDIDRLRQIGDQMAVALANANLLDELERLNWGALTALARAIDAKSHWTGGHSERVTRLAVALGKALDLDPAALETLRRGCMLHDIGKIGIPAAVLDKTSALTPEELEIMRSHVLVGARILEPVPALRSIIPLVLHHHEHYDGTGYPDGLAGETIPLSARILAVADAYDALTSDRPYRAGLAPQAAMERMQAASGSHFDPVVVRAFARVMAAGLDIDAVSPSEALVR